MCRLLWTLILFYSNFRQLGLFSRFSIRHLQLFNGAAESHFPFFLGTWLLSIKILFDVRIYSVYFPIPEFIRPSKGFFYKKKRFIYFVGKNLFVGCLKVLFFRPYKFTFFLNVWNQRFFFLNVSPSPVFFVYLDFENSAIISHNIYFFLELSVFFSVDWDAQSSLNIAEIGNREVYCFKWKVSPAIFLISESEINKKKFACLENQKEKKGVYSRLGEFRVD